jgi:TonB family protein
MPPRPAVKTGVFGDANGVAANSGAKPSTLARLGSFDMGGGGGTGMGSGAGSGRGVVQTGGFGGYSSSVAGAHIVRVSAPAETPVEILYKPKPVYTPEARSMHVEGDVQLEVIFNASGQIEVLRIVRSLGHGLDESARAAASQIRFRPGTRDGNPVDLKGIVHIVFELS